MNAPLYDIAISGAGPAGSALALALANKSPRPERIAVLGPQFAALGATLTPSNTAALDPRALALNYGSQVFLRQLQAWPTTAANILQVHVSQRGRLGRTIIDHTELGVPCLGSVVSYDALLSALHGALASSGVTLIHARPERIQLIDNQAVLTLGEHTLHSRIAVQSDGTQPQGLRREYQQHAVLATVRASHATPGWAYERFTRYGPLALLPHPEGDDLYAVVWCCQPPMAAELLAMNHDDFAAALEAEFGTRLGRFHCVAPKHVFPLSLHAGPTLLNNRCVSVGNAAQTLHPVAGQGLNLGLRDTAQLTHALTPWLLRPDSDPYPYLLRFADNRRPDRWLTAAITDFLPRIFSTRNPLVEHAAGLALLGMDILPPLRKTLSHQLLQGLRT
ncbi:FAD-dependent monooxygenase [Alcaligenaceae bacterium]|nr:FAD-dependent monooxygenase [Alcaligenaceae bacterium]